MLLGEPLVVNRCLLGSLTEEEAKGGVCQGGEVAGTTLPSRALFPFRRDLPI